MTSEVNLLRATFLKELVLTNGKNNKLKDYILTKIYLGSELTMVASHLVNAKNSKVIERLALSIGNQEQVYLKKYQSIKNSAYYPMCKGCNKSSADFTGLNVSLGISTKTVFQKYMPPFHKPGDSMNRIS